MEPIDNIPIPNVVEQNEQENNLQNTAETSEQPAPMPPMHKVRKKDNTLLLIAIMTLVFLAGAVIGNFSNSKTPKEEPQKVQRPVVEVDPSLSPVDKTPLQNVDTTVEDIVEDTLPALVSIQALIQYTEDYLFFGPQTITGEASGSGFIVQINEKEVAILTNAHVVEDAVEVTVTFNDGKEHTAIVKSCDAKADLALLSVDMSRLTEETVAEIKCVTLGDSDTLRLGQSVIAIGNALGYGQSVTTGVVSALNRKMTDEDGVEHTWIQTDAAINAGNSGGVLLDMNGRVVGVNEAKIADTGVEGMGFAIPITYALSTIDELSAVEARFPVAEEQRGKLGITCVEIIKYDSELYNLPQGIMVKEVVDEGGAAQAGIQPNDIIIALNNNETLTMNALSSALSFCAAGETVQVTVMRNSHGAWSENVFDVVLTP